MPARFPVAAAITKTLNRAELSPAPMNNAAGTITEAVLLASCTEAPPSGAAANVVSEQDTIAGAATVTGHLSP